MKADVVHPHLVTVANNIPENYSVVIEAAGFPGIENGLLRYCENSRRIGGIDIDKPDAADTLRVPESGKDADDRVDETEWRRRKGGMLRPRHATVGGVDQAFLDPGMHVT